MKNHHHHNRELSQPITWDTESCLHTALQLSAPRPGCVLAHCSLWEYQSVDAAAVQHLASQQAASMACMLIQALKTFPMKLFLQLSMFISILSKSKWWMTGAAKGGPNSEEWNPSYPIPVDPIIRCLSFRKPSHWVNIIIHRDSDQSLGRLHIFPGAAIQWDENTILW